MKTTLPAPLHCQGTLSAPSTPQGCTQEPCFPFSQLTEEKTFPLKGQDVITLKASKISLFQDHLS